MPRTKKRSGSNAQFPVRLHDMMEFVESNGLESVISWELGGRGFKIHNPDKLVDLLSLFFGQTKYTSFRRQLNMWHFDRIVHGPSKGTFLHPYFVKGNRELCGLMSRQIGVRDTRRSALSTETKQEDLGSFKSQVNRCTLPSARSSKSSTNSPRKAGNSDESCSRQRADDGSSAPMGPQANVDPPSKRTGSALEVHTLPYKSIPTTHQRSFLESQHGEILDLEPSPIAPSALGQITSLELIAAQQGMSYPDTSSSFASLPKTSFAWADEFNPFSLVDDDLGSFAGKQFFLVDNKPDPFR